jgi:sulfonate dioxygenase
VKCFNGKIATEIGRCTLHRVIPGFYGGGRRGVRTTVFGEKRTLESLSTNALKLIGDTAYFDPASESRAERERRQKSLDGTTGVNGHANGANGHSNGVSG